MSGKPSIAIIGAGIGGLAAAAAVRRRGIAVDVYEQADKFARVGAGIQQSPNAVRVLRGLGIEDRLRQVAFHPASSLNRDAASGAVTNDHPLGRELEQRYGAPYLTLHRGDLHEALASIVPRDCVHLGKKLVAIKARGARTELSFADGSEVEAEAVIGADGVHSLIRDTVAGPEQPRFIGRLAYRTTFPAALLRGVEVGPSRTKWWGVDRHIVIYFVKPDRSEVYFVTSQPEPGFTVESWSAMGDVNELRKEFSAFHPQVRHVLDSCPSVHKWALVDRDPLTRWSEGNVTLLGDACHPMTPYMAQGAAMAMEDAAVLSRCLAGVERDGVSDAFRRFEATRKPRTSRVQLSSRTNTWLKSPTDPDWVYGYDAWNAPLAELETA